MLNCPPFKLSQNPELKKVTESHDNIFIGDAFCNRKGAGEGPNRLKTRLRLKIAELWVLKSKNPISQEGKLALKHYLMFVSYFILKMALFKSESWVHGFCFQGDVASITASPSHCAVLRFGRCIRRWSKKIAASLALMLQDFSMTAASTSIQSIAFAREMKARSSSNMIWYSKFLSFVVSTPKVGKKNIAIFQKILQFVKPQPLLPDLSELGTMPGTEYPDPVNLKPVESGS